MKNAYDELLEYISGLTIVDTHEHLPHRETARHTPTDVLQEYLRIYFGRDLLSAGLPPADYAKVMESSLSIEEKWRLVEPYWASVRHTGYGQALDLSVRELYGIEEINGDTIVRLDNAFQASLQPGHFRRVLQEKSRIRVGLLDSHLDCDPEFFRSVIRLDHFILPQYGHQIAEIEANTGITITGLDDWLAACESSLENALKKGAVALKSGLAYQRSLFYEPTTYSAAQADFIELIRQKRSPDWVTHVSHAFSVGRHLQDYMMHFILRLANQRHLTFQFHTGLQEGIGNRVPDSDPSLLTNLFLQYPDVKFDLFHIGYPYQHVVSALAKNFPHVFIDMCWAHIISPPASIHALMEWLESVPVNKISAFGGDYCFVDGVYGHQLLARRSVAKALAAKVDNGLFDVAEAQRIAKMLLHDNPMRIFNLAAYGVAAD